MTQLSRLATIGIARESVPGTYLAPVAGIPFMTANFEDKVDPLRDESIRGNDTVLQGIYAGPIHAEWDMEFMAYPDLVGHFLRGIVGPDTVTAATSTTLSASTIAGATSISTPVSIAAGSIIRIDTAANTEYAATGTPTGSGPYTIPLVTAVGSITPLALTLPHTSSVAVTTTTKHTFKQDPTQAIPSYSLTVYDTTQTLGYSGLKWTDLAIKIDPKAGVTFAPKGLSFAGAPQSNATETYSTFVPGLGWTWTSTQNAVATTRGLSLDLAIKRAGEAINSSDGTQGPREIFVGALECDGTYKAIFENQTDINLFLNYTQQAVTATVSTPVSFGGASLAITMTKAGWTTGKRDLGSNYVQADFNLSGIYNATDAGAVSVVLQNWATAAY